MKKNIVTRVLAGILVVLMTLQLTPGTSSYARPAESSQGDDSLEMNYGLMTADASEDYFVPLINKDSAALTESLKVSYLEPLEFSLKDFTSEDGDPESIVFFYCSAEDPDKNWSEISDGPCTLDPGQYILTYSYDDPNEISVDGPDDLFGFEVTKATVSAPSNLHWDGSDPAWTAPTTTTDGGTLPQDVISSNNYVIHIYQNGEEVGNRAAFYYGYPNFANLITNEYKQGVYTYKAEVTVVDAHKKYFEDSNISELSFSFTTPVVKLIAGNGIESVSPAEHLLVPGDTAGLDITATVKSDYSFINWTGTGARFTDSTSAQTKVYIDAGYTGGTTLEITANAGDTAGPVISEFQMAGPGKLSARASDQQDGVAAYAFSTETSASSVTWTEVSPAEKEKTYEYTLTSGGTYYFYAKDAAGNISKSDTSIQTTEIKYHDYYTAAGPKAYSDFIIGTASVTPVTPVRPAYTFGGWYTDAELTTEAAESYSEHSATPYELYAKWTAVTLPEITVADETRTYTGNETKLSPVMTEVDGTLAYSWAKGGIEVATTEKLSVKNVSDSGTYSLTVTLKDAQGNTVDTKTVNNIIVSITKADLIITADNKTITYNAEAPEYTLTYDTLLGTDTKDVVTGTVTCSYKKGDSVGKYDILLTDFSADNYDITTHDGTLTVNADSSTVTAAFKNGTPSYTYEKDKAFEPEVEVTMSGQVLSPASYSVAYADNNKAGTATVTITSEYFDTQTLTFNIAKADFKPTVSMTGWKYGETKITPSLSEDHPEDGTVTWYYALKDSTDFTTGSPENAGIYNVYAVIEETANYKSFETAKVEFTISKREITITANSNTFVYDGLAHSDNGYEVTGDGFVAGQNFYSVTVSGSVTQVTPDDQQPNNTVTYVLTSNTLPGNYDIKTVPGTLKVTKDTLPAPYNPHWNTSKPGEAVWVPVSKRDLTVSYEVELLAYDGSEYRLVSKDSTTDSSMDLSGKIRTDARTNPSDSYFFTVKAVPTGGTNVGNYSEGPRTSETGEIFTALLTATGNNVSSYKFAGSQNDYVLLSGETVGLTAAADTGYKFSETAVTASVSEVEVNSLTNNQSDITAALKAALTASQGNVSITLHTEDKAPEIQKADFTNASPYSQVQISFKGTDELGLTGWVIKKDNTTPEEADWTAIAEVDGKAPTEYKALFNAAEPGQYYAFFRDTAGNVSVSKDCFTIYKYNFAPGADDVTGTMNPVLKEESATITLPKETYERDGHSFKDWKSTAGIFEDGAKISANPASGFEDTLTALWAENQYAYTVKYYLMGLDGAYPSDPGQTKTFYAAYDAQISSDSEALKLDLTGFTRDDSEGKKSSITIIEDGETLNVYYSRNLYDLTLSYTKPGDSEATVSTTAYYFGADLTTVLGDAAKPAAEGYVFVGWFFGDTGDKPSTMPAANVTATGYFSNNFVNYNIRYYLQDLKADGTAAATYTLYTDGNKTILAAFDEAISMDSTAAELPEGFSYNGAAITDAPYTDTRVSLPADIEAAVSGTAAEGRTINVFADRNTYTATLNVWEGKVNDGTPVYTWSQSVLYGAAFPADIAEKDKDQWPHSDDYRLADYIGWSTDTQPTTMPAGDVTVTRQFVLKVTGSFKVSVYLETDTDDVYESPRSFTFYDNVGKTVTVGNDETDTVKISDFASGIPYFQYYDYAVVEGEGGTLVSGTVTDTNAGEDPLVLRIYMTRKVMTSTISYYADTVKIAEVKKSAKWGHKYHYDPLSLFDSNAGGVWTAGDNTSGFTMTATVDGQNPDVYDFRNNNYVVVYSGGYILNDEQKWPNKDYRSVESLSENPGIIMGQLNNSGTVRYSKVSPDDMYELKLGYSDSNLSHPEKGRVPLTYKDEAAGLDFGDIRVANEAYFFENVSYVNDPSYAQYPGLGMYNLNNGQPSATTGRYIYDTAGDLKEGFSRVTINGKTYYQTTEDGKPVLYIPVTANNLYVGKWAGYSLPTDEVGYQDVTDFLAAYKAQWSEDPYAQGAYVYSRGWGSTIKYDTSSSNLTVTFRNGSVYQISYNLGGTVCSDESHRKAAGTSIDSIGCDHTIMHTRDGYDIVWYADSAFTTKPSLPFNLTSDKMFFGRYEKKIVKSTAYAYYETADHPEIGGKTYIYITEDDLETLGEAVTVTTGTEKKTITDDTGVSREVDLTTKTYTYDGKVVMESKEIPSLTFTDLTAAPAGLFSPEEGLRYDEANSANVVKGYVQDEGISFAAYYVRSKVTLSVDTKIDNVNVDITERRAGENITVATPTRGGYTFAGWTWEIYDSSQDKYVTWTAAPSYTAGATEITFRMPAENLKMTATWTTTDVSQTIYHFFQNHSGSYDKEATTLMLSETGTAATLSIGGSTIDCLVYSNGGLSYESNGIRLYYVNATAETTDAGTVYTIKQEDLAGSGQSLNALQEASLSIASNVLTVSQYSFSYALYQYENDITRLESDDNYTNRYGMVLEYYYDLDKYEVETESIVFGGNGTLSIIGSGEYYYGKEATLRAAMSAGYTFEGWYKTSDLPDGVTYEDLPKDKCISTDATISVRVTDDTSYTAIMKAMTVDEPTITITGDNSYRYNSSAAHVITAVADFGESADPTCYVSGYQWYMNGVAISGATAVNYKIPSDLVAGDYKFTCVVTAKRKDNGITKEVTSNEFTVKVEKDLLSAYTTAADHTAMYDTKSDHTITLDVAAPEADIYKIYYSTEKTLTAANCDTDGSETKPSFKDVKVTGGETDSYTVYYYVKSLNANYESCAGSNKVTINPAPLTLTAGTGTYSKTYDGSARVAGSAGPDGEGTDLYKLAHSTSVYVIHGLIGGDMTAGYIIDCKAEFNSAHTSDATAVTLSDIVLADNNGDILNNYAFEKTYTVIISGYIERRSLTLTWTNTVFDFDGSEHIPTAAISGTVPACDSDNLKVTVSGEQTYAGGWTALAHLSSEAAETHIDDYSVSNQSQAFTINKKSISVAMTSEEVTYDGGEHTLSDSSVTSGSLVSGHSYTLSADKSYIHSGAYNITPVNVAVTDADGADMTGNYDITCQNTGVLTINPKTVTVSGITAEDKTYDGTTAAELTLSGISFNGLVTGDILSLDKDKVTGTFDTKDAGEGKTVTISYLTGALSGSSAGDYSLDTANSQQTATASVNKKEVTVKADSKKAVYGETPAFSVGFDGFIAGEDSSVITGSVSYLVGNSQATAAAYTGKEHVGTYTIYPDVIALSADNYTFKSDHDTLTITERPLTVSAKAGALISKAYDGTTAVKTALVRDTHYEFAGVAGDTASGIINGDTVNLVYSDVYADAHPGNRTITVSSLSSDNSDYKIDTVSFTIPGEITQKILTVTAEKKTITYGDNAPTYTVKYSGFENGETEAVLSGTLAFSCDYDKANPANRGAGNYDIVPSGLTSDDYEIKFVRNILQVDKAEITLNVSTSPDTLIYGAGAMPTFSCNPTGFMYDDTSAVINIKDDTVKYVHSLVETEITDTSGTRKVISSVADDYPVTLEMTRDGAAVFTADNYTFKVNPAKVTVTRANLTIGNIRINSRVYDGTTKVYPDQLDYKNIVTAGLLGFDKTYFEFQGAENMFTVVNPTYNSKNVSDASEATFTITYGEYLAARYIPINDQTSAQAAITKRPVTITANNASVWFGDPAPAYDVTYEKATATSGRGLVSGETADKSHVTITCSYAPGDDVQKYTDAIVPSAFTGSTTALLSNYAPSYEPGDLDVKQRRLNTPAPVWKTNSPGVITWDEVPAVNKVEVDSYTVQLYADGTALTAAGAQLTVAANATLEADFLSLMRANGPGAYTVKVTAIASTVNNPNKEDVEDSLAGTSVARYAANMTFSFADDTISQAGKTDDIKVNGAASYVVIAGEKDIDITATLVNATGYTIKDVKAADTVSIIDKTDSARTADKFATRVSLAENHSSAADINIKLELSARPATLKAVVKPIANGDETVTNETKYGYSANTAPVFQVTTSHTDEVAPPSYTYSYAWDLRTSRTVEYFTDAAYNKDTWTLPLGKKANGSPSYYLVRCVVTATRSDNGQSITLNQSYNDYASKYAEDNSLYNVIVNKAAFTATVTMDGWTYGEVPKNPVLHYADAVKDNESIKITEYKYAPKGGNTWSDTKPSDAGEYQVKAYTPASGDYNEYTTPSVNFTVSKAKLDKPENLTMSHSSTADYGLISWDKVDGPKKDGTGTAVAVKYQVKLYKDGADTPFKTYDPIDGLSLDVTEDLQLGATYKAELTAISQDSANCQNSDSVFINDIAVGATISVSGTGTLSGNTFTQKYNATTIILTAQAPGNVTAYQWYEDGNELTGATGQIYTLSHVAESGKYTCVVTIDGKEVHTPIMNVVVTKRSLTLTSGSDKKIYDGTPLSYHLVKVTGDGFVASEGMDYNFTGTATNVSDTADNNNTFTASFKTGTAATDYETPVINYGKLTINPKEIVITPGFTYSEIPDVVYKAAAYTPEPVITDTSLAGGASMALVKDKDFTFAYSNNVNAGENTAKVAITGKGNYSGTVTLNFTIKKRPVVFSAVSEEKTYSGSEIKIEGLTVSSGTDAGLVTGHKHNVKFAASGTEASDTAYQGTITDKSAVVITLADGTTAVTDNYDITVNNGTLKIKQTEEAFTVSLPSDSHVYSGLDQYNTKTASDTAKTGTTKYEYSFTDGSGYVSSLSSLTKKDVGDYTIYVKATNPNYKNAATATATLTITKAPLTVVTYGASRAYNGNPLTNAYISVTGLKNGETMGSVTTGTITDKGTTDNTYTLTFAAADNSYTAKAGNYEVKSETKGTLEVTALAVNVTINGATLTKTYDGTEYKATGWSFTADSSLYKKEYISHTGPETAARTHVVEGTDTDGITDMGLAVSQFANTNTNFNVSFTVNDGWMKIEPLKNVTVSITGNNVTKTYDSFESTASGYNWDTANTLYKTQGSFTFNGTDSASRTNVVEGTDTDGRTDMGLREAQFTNTNTDFDEVKFSITDGYVQINPINGVTVSIIGDTYVNTYDGGSHTASGYSWSADNTLYRKACFSFSGTDSVTGKDAGKTFMGLKEAQFRNIDTNFTNVTFSVTDGYTDISKKAAKIKVKDSAKAYGNTDPAFTGDFIDVVPGETLVGVVYRRTNSAEDVGYYSKVLTADYGNNPNYDITVENADFEITKTNTLTVTGTSYSDIYDGNVHGLPAVANVTTGTTIYYSLDGGVNWDTEVPTIKDVDEFTVDVKAVNSNYSDAFNSYTLEVLPKEVTVTAEDKTKIYGFDDPVLTVVKSGLLGTDDVKVDIARDSGETVGTYKIKATGTVLQGNYKLKFVDGTFTIDKRPVMLVWSTDEFVFDTEEKDITAEIVNVVTHAPAFTAFRLFAARALNSDDVYVSGYKNNTGVNAGTYTAEATSLGGADAGNYILINATHQWKILKAASILKVTDETVTYDGGKHSLKVVLEQGTGTVTAFGDENPDAGTYTVTFRAAETDNYLGAEAKGTLTILPKNVEDPAKPFTEIKDIDISKPAEKTYDSTEQTQDFKVTDKAIGSGKKLTSGQDFDVSYKNNVNAGTAEVYFIFKGNYSGNIKKTFVINPAELTLKVKDAESRQGSALAAPEVEVVSGQLYGNDTPGQITYNMAQMTAPGEYPITAEIAAGTENANYKVTFLPGVYRLTAAPVVPTPDVKPDDGGETKPSVRPEDTTEETVPESTTEIDDGDLPDAGGKICYWHFIMLAIDLIWLIIMLIAGRRLKEEDEELRAKKQKKGRWLYGIFAAVAAIIIMVLCIPGFCNLDIIIAIASVVFVILSAIFSCRHKFSRKAEQER